MFSRSGGNFSATETTLTLSGLNFVANKSQLGQFEQSCMQHVVW